MRSNKKIRNIFKIIKGKTHLLASYILSIYSYFIDTIEDAYVTRSILLITEFFGKSQKRDEVTLFCLVKNGGFHIDEFLRHYRNLGIKRMVFLDNGSVDETIAKLKFEYGINICFSNLKFGRFEPSLKRCIVKKYSGKGWALIVDIDEHFDFPYRERRSIGDLLTYLNNQKVNAVISQMLDVYNIEREAVSTANWINEHRFYDLSAVQSGENLIRGVGKSPRGCAILPKKGGIRSRLYGATPYLTKVPFFRPNFFLQLRNSHSLKFSRFFANYADFTCVLIHYKFTGDFVNDFMKIADGGVIGGTHLNINCSKATLLRMENYRLGL